jgi:predicted nuclease of predicted toxin-antitoxin system
MPKRPPDPGAVFFIDRSLGSKVVAETLRAAGVAVEIHDAHFARDCADEVWIAEVAARGWIIVTKDERILRRALELAALEDSGAAAFVLRGGDMKGERAARSLSEALPRIASLLRSHTRPLIVTVSSGSKLEVRVGERRGGIRR